MTRELPAPPGPWQEHGYLEAFGRRAVGPEGPWSAISGVVAVAGEVSRFSAGESCPIADHPPPSKAQPLEPAQRFDLASLAKPFVATLALELASSGALPLDTSLGEVLVDEVRGLAASIRGCRLEALLRHRGRVDAWAPLYATCRSPANALETILEPERWKARQGTYSDLGYILWGRVAERALGESLWNLLAKRVLAPLEMATVEPTPGARPGIAACRCDTGMEARLSRRAGIEVATLPAPDLGQPQDGNARFLGGFAGHAGLFGSADDVMRLGREWLRPQRLLSRAQVTRALAGNGTYRLGFSIRTVRGSAGRALSRGSFGHTGFAGGSLWIDPDRDSVMVLLGHRKEPFSDLNAWRRRFHRLALRGLPRS